MGIPALHAASDSHSTPGRRRRTIGAMPRPMPALLVSCTCVCALLAVARPGLADDYGTVETFHGWSKDGTFHLETSLRGDLAEVPTMCLSEPGEGSQTWPKGVPYPEDGAACVAPCGEDDVVCFETTVKQAAKWLRLPRSSRKGPHGETVTVRFGPYRAIVRVTRGERLVAWAVRDADRSWKGAQIQAVYWRPDGGAVVVVLGPPEDKPDPDGPDLDFRAQRYLVFVDLAADPRRGAPPDPDAAKAANTRGFGLYAAGKYAEAAKAYRAALAADDSLPLAHYNLACAAALLGDEATVLEQLEWLGASSDALARRLLVKGRTDADLRALRGRPKLRRALGLAEKDAPPADAEACRKECQAEAVACQDECTRDRTGDERRGCAGICRASKVDCAARCAPAAAPASPK
jgi:hypothetical protein